MVIFDSWEKCKICEGRFIGLEIHHINGNHQDNRKENLIEICKRCHVAIHRNINSKSIRKFENESDEEAILKIHELRKKLHLSRRGNLKYLQDDKITHKVKRILFWKEFEKEVFNVNKLLTTDF